MINFVLVSKTPRVTAQQLTIIAIAINQNYKKFADDWGLASISVTAAGSKQSPQPKAIAIWVMEKPSEPNAVAWHSEDADGHIVIEVSVAPVLDNGGSVLDGGKIRESVAQAIDHEIKETMIDPSINQWCDRFDGTEVAKEVCDPVQGDLYFETVMFGGKPYKVGLSNWVTPSWFDPQAATGSKLDAIGTAPAQLHLARGGYMALRHVGKDMPAQFAKHTFRTSEAVSDVTVVYGDEVPAWKRERILKRVEARLRGHENPHPATTRRVA